MLIPEGDYILIEDYARKNKLSRFQVHYMIKMGKLKALSLQSDDGKIKLKLIELSTD